jgi:hypothetical protein
MSAHLFWDIAKFFMKATWFILLLTFLSTIITISQIISAEQGPNSKQHAWLQVMVSAKTGLSPKIKKLIQLELVRTNLTEAKVLYVGPPDDGSSGRSAENGKSASTDESCLVDTSAQPEVEGVNMEIVSENSMAQIESLLNIEQECIQLTSMEQGLFSLVTAALMKGKEKRRKSFSGLCLLTIASMTPGTMNWIIASARDANLFN